MKPPFKSIRWRLQIWHGAILVVVLSAFGYTAYQLALENRLRLIDQALQHHTEQLVDAFMLPKSSLAAQQSRIGRAGRSTNSLIDASVFRSSGADTNLALLDGFLNPRLAIEKALLPESGEFYFAFWDAEGALIRRSRGGPSHIAPPPASYSGHTIRMRGDLRELVMANQLGLRSVVGCAIAGDLADLHRQAWWMALAGSGIAVLGLAGGWWVASRAIKPIAEISSTAQKITAGNLTERINVADTDSELGQLATVLNATFDRQQSAFNQLKSAFERQAEFTADASHELRTPVAVIISEAESALARERTPAEYREGMESCLRAAVRMQRLTESLLTLARLDSGGHGAGKAPCDLERVVRGTLKMLQPLAAQNGVSLKMELSNAVAVGNEEQLGQVMANLISNAISYNRPGGGVVVRLAMERETAVIAVSDDGRGITAEDLPHVFERFYRADKARSHSQGHVGLGLAIVKAIVEAHHGTIQVSSVTGKGSTFVVRLPR